MRHVALGFAFLILCGITFAQVGGTGSIEGTVTDPSGAVVVGATVTAKNTGTGVETTRSTTEAGVYVIPLLPAGEYSVIVKKSGFQGISQEHVSVEALANVSLSFKLQIGSASQTITVEEEPTLLKTDDVALGSSMDNERLRCAASGDERRRARSFRVRRSGGGREQLQHAGGRPLDRIV